MSHTPGPWTADLVHGGMHWHIGGDVVVAECPAGTPKLDADARLITAAPDLLAALKSMLSPDSEHDIEDAIKAIAKAEGR